MAPPGAALAESGRRNASVRFTVDYYTQWGQCLIISGSGSAFGCWDVKQGLSMKPHHDGNRLLWQAELLLQGYEGEYNYCVVDDKKNVVRWESGQRRKLIVPSELLDGAILDIRDIWQAGVSPETLFARSAFDKVIFRGYVDDTEGSIGAGHNGESFPSKCVLITFNLSCVVQCSNQSVWVSGSTDALGNMSHDFALRMRRQDKNATWQAKCAVEESQFPLRYHYFIKCSEGKLQSEQEGNRELCLAFNKSAATHIVCNDGYFRGNLWRGAGLAVPVFSLRSMEGVGTGEFLDLKLAVDLARKSGLRLVQLLPVNDTSVHGTWWDSYPYSSLSVFALHPLYLRLQAMEKALPRDIEEEIHTAKLELDFKDVDYEAVMKLKMRIAKEIFHRSKNEVLNSVEFKNFFHENKEWLRPYSAFCFLRDLFETSEHSQWGLYSNFSEHKLEKLVAPESEFYSAISFVYYIQYHLHKQLSEVAAYARRNGVVLKGDLPIGVGRNSVDTWAFPNLFRLNTSTGAPPDYFDKNGQNWGFPTYNWEEMSKDDYAWWRSRLTQMAKYFDAYRIDHILGFFRIWELPDHAVTGLMGRFRPSIPLSQEELEAKGVWDFNRLCEPYVRSHLLQEAFGGEWREVASKYFEEYHPACYRLKEEYASEKNIVAKVESAQTAKKLFSFLQNVVLMRSTENPRHFYPRFGLDETSSYRELDEHNKSVIIRLYYDYFYHRQEELWRKNALKTLPVLMRSSNMLTCGEDLGMVPACVQPVLSELGLLGLRIQRMPNTPGQEFADPSEYEYMTVCAPSCHDCSTMRAWWEEDAGRRARFFEKAFGLHETPADKCTSQVASLIIGQHLRSPSMWAIFPLQDLMALNESFSSKRAAKEETINDPSNPRHYWRFRIHVSLEEMLEDECFSSTLKRMVVSSGRADDDED